MLHIVMQMVLYCKNHRKVNKKFVFYAKIRKLVTQKRAGHKI